MKLSVAIPLIGALFISMSNKDLGANEHIQRLKDGALFVRLQTASLKIEGLKSVGRHREAEETRMTQKVLNQAIMLAFQKNYTFSKVYFFYNYNSDKIRASDFNILLDGNGSPISSAERESIRHFYIAEFKNLDLTSVSQAGGGGFEGLVVHDANFKQLERPFPYFSRSFSSMKLFYKGPSTVVSELNEALHKFAN